MVDYKHFTISQLEEVINTQDTDLFTISRYIGSDNWQSKKITLQTILDAIDFPDEVSYADSAGTAGHADTADVAANANNADTLNGQTADQIPKIVELQNVNTFEAGEIDYTLDNNVRKCKLFITGGGASADNYSSGGAGGTCIKTISIDHNVSNILKVRAGGVENESYVQYENNSSSVAVHNVDTTTNEITVVGGDFYFKNSEEIEIAGSTGNDGTYTVDSATESLDDVMVFEEDIYDVDTTNNIFTLEGDHSGAFNDGDTFDVVNSTGNDGAYTVSTGGVNVTEDGGTTVTEITVDEDITDGTVDGQIQITEEKTVTTISINEDITDGTTDGDVIYIVKYLGTEASQQNGGKAKNGDINIRGGDGVIVDSGQTNDQVHFQGGSSYWGSTPAWGAGNSRDKGESVSTVAQPGVIIIEEYTLTGI